MSRLLIHGAGGFVGSTLAERLATSAATGYVLVDRNPLAAGHGRALREGGADVRVHRAASLAGLPPEGEVDTAIVLAGQTDVDEALAEPARAFGANMDIAVDVGEWARRHRTTRVVYVSSDEVLGPSDVPLAEDAPMRPTQPYAASKAAAEMVLRCYADTYGLDVVVLRSCNLIGGRQRARKLIPTAVTALLAGRPVPVFGDGSHVREWLAVEDLCEAVLVAADRSTPPGTYHCASGVRLSVSDVIRRVAAALEVEPGWTHVTDRLVHDRSYAMDSGLLRSYGWKPERDIGDAIAAAARAMARAARGGEVLTVPPAGQ
jgi:dTDP-glucose 4,6-dehydratase